MAEVAKAHDAAVSSLGTMGTRQAEMEPRLRKLPSKATHLVVGDEAGPWGDGLSRDLTPQGQVGWVVAPSRLPNKAGDRVQTARRDARPLARRRRAGDLSPGDVPQVEDEASRDRTRARAAAIRERKTAKVRLNAVRRRHDRRSTGRAAWGPAPLRWRSEVVCPTPAPPMVFQADVRAGPAPPARLPRLEQARQDHVHTWRRQPVVEALQAVRGVQCTVAVTLVAALGDLSRFDHPRQLMTSLGRSPSASSSGARRRQGASTTAGQTPARRARLAGAWAYRSPATVSRHVQRRLAQLPKPLPDRRWKAQGRRCQRDHHRMARGQHANQVVVASARELVGCLWAMATHVP